jgi:hypothetical protein
MKIKIKSTILSIVVAVSLLSFVVAIITIASDKYYDTLVYYKGFTYDAITENVTQEDNYAHLNMSDAEILQYFSFDVQDDVMNWVEGNVSNGLWLDGGNDWVNLSNMGSPSGATISLWIKQPVWNNGGEYIMDGRNSAGSGWWYLSDYVCGSHCSESTGNICFNCVVGINAGNFTANTWYNVVVVFNSTFTKIYLNGELKDTGSGTTSNLQTMRMGTRYTNSGYINATYDELRIFNRVLNDTEIEALFNHEVLNETGLISELLFDEKTGNIAYNSSSNEVVGTLMNVGTYTYDFSNYNLTAVGLLVNTSENGNKFTYSSDSGYIGGAYTFVENFTALANYDAAGITQNGTFMWVIDYLDLKVYKYWMNGTFTRDYFETDSAYATKNYLDRGNNRGPYGIIQNNTFFWISHYREAEVFKFWMNGTYTGTHFDTAASGCGNPRGMEINSTHIWIVDDNDDEVYVYWINGTYTNIHWDTAGSPGGNNNPFGIAGNDTFFWITDDSDDRLYRYFANGTYNSNFSISASGARDARDVATNSTFLWITDYVDARIYLYFINGTYWKNYGTTLDTRPAKYIRAPIVVHNNSNFTLNFWVKPYNHSTNDRGHITNLYGNYDGWCSWNVGGSGSCNVGNGTDQGISASAGSFPEGQWSMYTFMRNGTNFSIWSNGVLKGSKLIVSGTLRQDLTTFQRIGAYGTGYQQINWLSFNGSIDEFMVINRTLTQNEIKQIYNNTFTRFYPTGEMFFDNINIVDNQTVNVTITNCQQLNGTTIEVKFNNGDYQTLNSTCSYDSYIVTENLTNANMTIKLNSNGGYYSPIVAGDINLESYPLIHTNYVDHNQFGNRTGVSSSINGPKTNDSLLWKTQISLTGDFDWFAGVSIVGGYVYAMQKNSSMYFYKLSAETGDIICSSLVGETDGTPVIYDEVAYVTTMNWTNTSSVNRWIGVIAINTTNCEVIWNSSIKQDFSGSVALNADEGIVYAGAWKGVTARTLFAFNISNGNSLWNYTSDMTCSTSSASASSPTYSNGVVYYAVTGVTASSTKSFLHAINSTNGSLIWKYVSGASSAGVWDSSPVVYGDSVYINKYIEVAQNLTMRFRLTDGVFIQNYTGYVPLGLDRSFVTLSIHDDILWSIDHAGYMYAYYINGTKKCDDTTNFNTGPFYASPVIADDMVYFTDGPEIVALSETNCSVMFRYRTDGDIYSQLSLADNVLYFFSDDGYLYALGEYPDFEVSSDITIPTITFESPTPDNSSTVTYSTQTIVANISDISNVSSWIDFDRSLVGYWSMDYYNTTHILDNSSYNNLQAFGRNSSSSNISEGIRGNSMAFTNASAGGGYLSSKAISSNIGLEYDNWTVSVWVKQLGIVTAYGGRVIEMWTNSGEYPLVIRTVSSSTKLEIATYNGTLNPSINTANLGLNSWNNVLVRRYYNGTKMVEVYINGQYNTSLVDATSGDLTGGTFTPTIGGTSEGIRTMNGLIDEVMIFNRSLSTTEIAALYNSQSNKFNVTLEGLLSHWHNYTVYAINEKGRFNSSYQTFISNTCTYPGNGNWNVYFSDYCNITSDVTGDGSDLTITGVGEFSIIGANITGFPNVNFYGNTGANSQVKCFAGGCFI